jgi:hypothetical protein
MQKHARTGQVWRCLLLTLLLRFTLLLTLTTEFRERPEIQKVAYTRSGDVCGERISV